nr:hypothetical protein HmN_000858500 [Hymenolepis microstoma]
MKLQAFSLLYLNLLYFISGFAIHEAFDPFKEVNDDEEIDRVFRNKFNRTTDLETTDNFSNSTDGTTTDPSTMKFQELTDNWNDSSNVNQATVSKTLAENEGEFTALVATEMKTNAILTESSTSKSDELKEEIDYASTEPIYETYSESERANSENSDLTKSYIATHSDNMDSTPTDPVISEGEYTKNDRMIYSESKTISQWAETNKEMDNSALTIEYDSSKSVSEDSTLEQHEENTEEYTERCEDFVTDQVLDEGSDKEQEKVTEDDKVIISTNDTETEASLEGTTGSLRRFTSLTQNIRHHFSIVRSNIIKAAESMDSVMESLRLALESAVENLFDSFSNLNEKDLRNEAKSEGQFILEKALEQK